MTVDIASKTEVLVEALPYIEEYEGKTLVIKYGGAAMVNQELREDFGRDVALLKRIGIDVVIVHGGGREITTVAEKMGVPSRFVNGLRYTNGEMMDVVQMVLAGKTNQDVVAGINRFAGMSVGLCGIDADLLKVTKHTGEGSDLGFVGEVTEVNTAYLRLLLEQRILPVIAPIGVDADGRPHNINADAAASSIAGAISAEKLVYLSDVPGVIANGSLIPTLDQDEAARLIEEGVVGEGMIPKIRSAFAALDEGVGKVHIIDGRVRHAILLE
ncbi:MAG: acetylglutamate kinase, partial [Bacteroidota bacterium]